MNTNRHTVRDRAKHDEQKRDMGANQMNKWIHVKKKMPENGRECIVCLMSQEGKSFVTTGWYIDCEWHDYTGMLTTLEAVCWQPLPESPFE